MAVIPYQRLAALVRAVLRPLLPVVLVVAGLGLLSYGLWMAWPPLGYLGAGTSCLCVEMAISDRRPSNR
ncbi:hypothetical protein [Kitasatospora sp. A2-31]|uniref:hypothetical protein n=1 Tax=Kitasatospora sp. A2-31 TaxID=2916414 RepID=UPI001EE7EC0B|nr:hypothetical protein [Kitasatospora sp. A2-31]MCG6493429.1 hypothetical protein [Kitasatospora sp. A2-31]